MKNFFKPALLVAVLLAASFALGATIKKDHFDGGKNLTKGSKKGSAGTLAELIIGLQDKDVELGATDAAIQASVTALGTILVVNCTAGAGGGATEALTCTGLLGTDTVLAVTQKTAGANSLPLLGWSTLAADTVTGVWSADPGAGAVVSVAVKR